MATLKQKKNVEYRIVEGNAGFKPTSRGMGLYLLQSDTYYKIGYTTNLENRLSTLQSGNPHTNIKVVLWIQTPEAKKWEFILHEMFADKRVFREWFNLADDDVRKIMKFIEKLWRK